MFHLIFRLLTSFSHNSAIHKEMLAILAAVTEVIKEKNGTENSTEYFGALVSSLVLFMSLLCKEHKGFLLMSSK